MKQYEFRRLVSSAATNLHTYSTGVLKQRMPLLDDQHSNQFGYKRATSCRSEYYVVNETIGYYKSGRSNCHVISQDATKAFDKLWQGGLFINSSLELKLVCGGYCISIMMRALL
jgi:hypothetical protein